MARIGLIRKLKLYYRAIRRPEMPRLSRTSRQYRLLRPGWFDLRSLRLQLRDIERLPRVELASSQENEHFGKVYEYNAGVTVHKLITTTRRAEIYFQILALPPRNVAAESLLLVGPRNIQEFVIADAYGFSWENMTGLDLYSTNPKIVEGNMEHMPFDDESFDNLCMAHTFAYADDPYKCLEEMFRVLKTGGRCAFGFTHVPTDPDWKTNRIPPENILEHIRKIGFSIYVHDSAPKINVLGQAQESIWVGMKKV